MKDKDSLLLILVIIILLSLTFIGNIISGKSIFGIIGEGFNINNVKQGSSNSLLITIENLGELSYPGFKVIAEGTIKMGEYNLLESLLGFEIKTFDVVFKEDLGIVNKISVYACKDVNCDKADILMKDEYLVEDGIEVYSVSEKPIESIAETEIQPVLEQLTQDFYTRYGEISDLVTLEGTSEVLHADDFENKKAYYWYYIRLSDGTKYELIFPSGENLGLISGRTIRVTGKLTGSVASSGFETFNVENLEILDEGSVAGEENPNLGEQRTAVVLINFANLPYQPFNPIEVQNIIFNSTDTNSATSIINEMSYGKTRLIGEVYGWYTLPINVTDPMAKNFDYIKNAAINFIDPLINFNDYKRLIILEIINAPIGGQSTSGLNEVVTNDGRLMISTIVMRYNEPGGIDGVLLHELGHSFGLLHANDLECGNFVVGATNCEPIEYGDNFDTMGQGTAHYNAIYKNQLGWLDSSKIVELQDGKYYIEPLQTISNGIKAVKSSDSGIYIEYRKPVGYEFYNYQNLKNRTGGPYEGVFIHKRISSIQSGLLDTSPHISSEENPQWQDSQDVVLRIGQTYNDEQGIFSVTVNQVTENYAEIEVEKNLNLTTFNVLNQTPLSLYMITSTWNSTRNSPNASQAFYSYPLINKFYGGVGISRISLPFFTSIPKNSEIISAKLKIELERADDIINPNSNDFITLIKTDFQNPPQMVLEDFDKFGEINKPIEGSNRIYINALNVTRKYPLDNFSYFGYYIEFNLNSEGLSWINQNGLTMLGLRGGDDVLGPLNESGYRRLSLLFGGGSYISGVEYSSYNLKPKLEVIYRIPICHDGIVEIGEQCDDGNTINGDGCNSQCQLETSSPLPEKNPIKKNRYISFIPSNSGKQTALRVKLADLPDKFAQFEGQYRWVGNTKNISELGGTAQSNNPPNFRAAKLECSPVYLDFGSLGLINAYGTEIIPNSTYEVQTYDLACGNINDNNCYSAPLTISTSRWGDIVGPFVNRAWSAPDGRVDIASDVSATLDKFRNGATAPIKTRADVEPMELDHKIQIMDTTRVLDAFRGFQYPFNINQTCGSSALAGIGAAVATSNS